MTISPYAADKSCDFEYSRMGIEARINTDRIAVHSRIHITDGTPAGEQVAPIRPGVKIQSWAGSNRPYGFLEVLANQADGIVIQENSGSCWRLTPLKFGEHPSSIETFGMASQDWVVRSAV